MRSTVLGLALALALACTTWPARASDLRDYHAAVADAYAFYRSAVFYLRTGNATVAGFELEQMRERWQKVEARFSAAIPDAYRDAPAFAVTLRGIGERVRRAADAAGAGDGDGASAALGPIRTELAALRAAAGVRVFSDCVDEVNAAMDALYVYRKSAPRLGDAAAVNDVKAKAAVLRYLLERCDREASDAVRTDPEFRRLVDGAVAGVGALFAALDRKDATAVVNVLRELHSFDRILFLRFG